MQLIHELNADLDFLIVHHEFALRLRFFLFVIHRLSFSTCFLRPDSPISLFDFPFQTDPIQRMLHAYPPITDAQPFRFYCTQCNTNPFYPHLHVCPGVIRLRHRLRHPAT